MKKKAEAPKVGVSVVIRDTADTRLAGVTEYELRLIDSATRQAAIELEAMTKQLKATNAKFGGPSKAQTGCRRMSAICSASPKKT